MSRAPQCSRGWDDRCAASHGTKCRCKCGGANHGKFTRLADTASQAAIAFANRHANYCIETVDEREVVIRDLGPWDSHPTITNDAAWVVAQFAASLNGRQLAYYDSDGRLDVLRVENGRFAGYAPYLSPDASLLVINGDIRI